MAEFDKELYMCRALTCGYDEETEVKGFLIYRGGKLPCITEDNEFFWEVNSYSLCRNTGIKKNDVYLYENDLVEYSDAFNKGMAMIEFDDMRCRYMLRKNLDCSGRTDIEGHCIKVIGNVVLNDDDMKKFAEYSKKENESYILNVEPECRSKQHLNKKAKEFLPK